MALMQAVEPMFRRLGGGAARRFEPDDGLGYGRAVREGEKKCAW